LTWVREPFVHFVLLGIAIFALHAIVRSDDDRRTIVVTDRVLETLRQDYEQRLGSPPDAEQRAALVAGWVVEEVLYREALRLGIDEGDIIVRRRLVQSMRFLTEDATPLGRPDESQLQAILDANPERYAQPRRSTGRHVFVSCDRHGDACEAVAAQLLTALAVGTEPSTLGDPFIRGATFQAASEADLSSVFGAGFAAGVSRLSVGPWTGPIGSIFGLHLVEINDVQEAQLPAVDGSREALAEAWFEREREISNQRAIRRVVDSYEVVRE
jgi:hypothetical protein